MRNASDTAGDAAGRSGFGLTRAVLAICVGGSAFLLNDLEVQLGWGVHFLFGNAFAWFFLRLLGPVGTTAAVSIGSASTLLLWNHPWAWLVWTLAAIFVARFHQRLTPVGAMAVFWICCGGWLILLFYGGIMGMAMPSAGLIALKQAVNAIANVVVAEVLYLLAVPLCRRVCRVMAVPAPPTRAAIVAVVMAFVIVPPLVLISARANKGAESIDRLARTKLELAHESAASTLENRLQGRVEAFSSLAVLTSSPNFSHADCMMSAGRGDGSESWVVPVRADSSDPLAHCVGKVDPDTLRSLREILEAGSPRISDLHAGSQVLEPHAELLAPVTGQSGEVVALVYQAIPRALLDRLLTRQDSLADVGVVVVDRKRSVVGSNSRDALPPFVTDWIRANERPAVPVVLGNEAFGVSLMRTLSEGVMVHERPLAAPLEGWSIVAFFEPHSLVIQFRRDEQRTFAIVSALILAALALVAGVTRVVDRSVSTLGTAFETVADKHADDSSFKGLPVAEFDTLQQAYGQVSRLIDHDRRQIGTYERMLRLLSEYAPVILYVRSTDIDSIQGQEYQRPLTYISASVERILGYTPDEVVDPDWWGQQVHPDDLQAACLAYSKVKPGSAVAHEYRMRKWSGEYIWLYDILVVDQALQDGCVDVYGFAIDVTKRKEAELQLLQTTKLASIGEMATGMAHELKQPLSTIRLAAVNLVKQLQCDRIDRDAMAERLQRIDRQTQRAADLIEHLRKFGRIPSEEAETFPITHAVSDALSLLHQQLYNDDIAYTITDRAEGALVYGKKLLLEQVVLNLVLNARDAIVGRRSVTPDAGRILIDVDQREGRVYLRIQDDGGGISSAVLTRIFEPFFTTKEAKSGTGLGLSIARNIVVDMGGTISVENVVDGSRFTIDLPHADMHEDQLASAMVK